MLQISTSGTLQNSNINRMWMKIQNICYW